MCPNNRGGTIIRVHGVGPPAPSGGQRWARVGWLKSSRMPDQRDLRRRAAGAGGRGARTPPPPRRRPAADRTPQGGRRGARPAAGPTSGRRDDPQVASGNACHRGSEPRREAGERNPAALLDGWIDRPKKLPACCGQWQDRARSYSWSWAHGAEQRRRRRGTSTRRAVPARHGRGRGEPGPASGPPRRGQPAPRRPRG